MAVARPRWQRWGRHGAAGLALSHSAHALPAPATHHACPCFALVRLQVSHTLMNLSGGRFARQELQCEWLHRAGLVRGARSRIVRHHEMLPRSGKKGRSLSAAEKGHCGYKSNPNSFETLVPRGPGPHRTSPHKLGWGVLVSAGSQPLDAAKAKLIADGETVSTADEDGPDANYVVEAWSRGYSLVCIVQLVHRAAACNQHIVGVITFRLPLPHKRSILWRWLFGLLVLQSLSSIVLDSYQGLLKEHFVVTLFLTTLVGAGGNAGNQSSIKVIRGLATGCIKPTVSDFWRTLTQQASVGILLAVGLSVGGFARVYITNGSVVNSFAIGVSLFCIVLTSVVTGTGLPFALTYFGIDPANAGTTIQVVMDISGTSITCAMCNVILNQLAASLAT